MKARVEVSRVTDSGKGYRDQVVVMPPESTMPSYTITCPAGEFTRQMSNCYGYPVVQYTLPAELCQSEFGGRDGSNACTLICILLGLQFKKQVDFPSPLYSNSLPPQWKTAIANAFVDGNALHDCVFEGQAINVDVEDAFENFAEELELAAYDEQQCHCPNQDLDNLVALFTSTVRDTQAGVLVADGRTISVLSYAQGEFVIVDTHKHSENGSLVGVSNDIVSLV